MKRKHLFYLKINPNTMSRILIEYAPSISEKSQIIIEENITPSMTSQDGETSQYCVDFILSDINNLPAKDIKLIKELQSEGVEYLEF